jgi:hypothetical protein
MRAVMNRPSVFHEIGCTLGAFACRNCVVIQVKYLPYLPLSCQPRCLAGHSIAIKAFKSLSKRSSSSDTRVVVIPNDSQGEREEGNKTGHSFFSIKIRFNPPLVVLLCLECFRGLPRLHALSFYPLFVITCTLSARRDLFLLLFALRSLAETTRSSRAFCARPLARRPWGRGRIASCWGGGIEVSGWRI